MTKIISVSLDESMLKDIDEVGKRFSGRSEAVRTGMKLLLEDVNAQKRLNGHAECVLILVHKSGSENSFLKIKHNYDSIINTQVHNNLCNDKCLEVFFLHGDAEKINNFLSDLRRNKRTEYVKLIIA